jgi:sugar lactone lactonase YvrE
MMQAEKRFASAALLGEGASWDAGGPALWWVDILGRKLFRGDMESGRIESWVQPTEIGASIASADGRRVLILRDRVEMFDPASGAHMLFWQGYESATNRFNDAATDRQGNLWVSSMDFDASAPTGALWRVTPVGEATKVLSGYAVVNGPVFSPDGRTLYFADTMAGKIMACDYDATSGTVSEPRLFLALGPFDGLADGMAMDAEGCLWLARITAGRVARYDPNGQALLTIALPVPMVTSCAFGGADLSLLFITTARILLNDADLAAYPDSGSVYCVPTQARGLPSIPFQAGNS